MAARRRVDGIIDAQIATTRATSAALAWAIFPLLSVPGAWDRPPPS